jgi:acyl-CoA-binding protein
MYTFYTNVEVKLDNDTQLLFYALYKQISEGENKTKQPSKLKFV